MFRPKMEDGKLESKTRRVVRYLIEGNSNDEWIIQNIFDGSYEKEIKEVAAKKHLSIVEYIKSLVLNDLDKNQSNY